MKILAAISLVILLGACDAPVPTKTQYVGQIYPEIGDENNFIYLGEFASLDDCQDTVSDALDFYERENGTEGKGSYDCDEE